MLAARRKVAILSFVATCLFLAIAFRSTTFFFGGVGYRSGSATDHSPGVQVGEQQQQENPVQPSPPDDILPGDLPAVTPEKDGSDDDAQTEKGTETGTETETSRPPPPSADFLSYSKSDLEQDLIVASTKKENTSWFDEHLPDWHKTIYVVDKSSFPLSSLASSTSSSSSSSSPTIPKNKGREAMVYLSYMIDNYDSLPRTMLFVHASRFAWHNDDPDYDALATLRGFRPSYLLSRTDGGGGDARGRGYVNLRCVWTIGCPNEIRPLRDAAPVVEGEGKITAAHAYKAAFEELLPGVPVPELVAVSCCSQFAVTREAVRSRPLADYVRWRQWLLDTPLEDAIAGRVFEFTWHIIFGKEAVHCPSAAECYCNVFGICDIPCDEGTCASQYKLPPFSTLPSGWPTVGWDGEARNFSGPL